MIVTYTPVNGQVFKSWRALWLKDYCRLAGYPGVVCFSCGNASKTIDRVFGNGLQLVDVAPGGSLQAGRWWTPEDIRRAWPHLLDATSGHLPLPATLSLGLAYKQRMGNLARRRYKVATGSGETLVALASAYPETQFVAVYDSTSPSTTYQPKAPLNALVRRLAYRVEGAT